MFKKVLSGIITLTSLMFSSYDGNIAEFSKLLYSYQGNRIVLSSELTHSFDNDFEDFFYSGTKIIIWFNLKYTRIGDIPVEKTFKHTVVYDVLSSQFEYFLEETDLNGITDSWDELIKVISNVDYSIELSELEKGNYIVELSAEIEPIFYEEVKEEIDLMLLWGHRSPEIKEKLRIENKRL